MHMLLISASFIIFLRLDCCHDYISYWINEIWNIRGTHVCTRFLRVIASVLLWAFCLWAFVNIMQMWVIIALVEIFVYSESLVMSHKPSRARNTCFPVYQITSISNSTRSADRAASFFCQLLVAKSMCFYLWIGWYWEVIIIPGFFKSNCNLWS